MQNTSSYFSIHRHKNTVCFSRLISNNSRSVQYIILEKEKTSYYSKESIESLFKDIISIGLNISYELIEGEYLIHCEKLSKKDKIFLGMTIRIIYEGKYLTDTDDSKYHDYFYRIFEHYNKLKTILKKEKNKLVILCLANACFVKGNFNSYNTNHCLIHGRKANIRVSLDWEKGKNVNNYFSNGKVIIEEDIKLKKPKDWKKSDYIKIFKELKLRSYDSKISGYKTT